MNVSGSISGAILREERPWGSFRVFFLNSPFKQEWVRPFFASIGDEYPGARKGDGLEGHLETLSGKVAEGTPTTIKIISVNPRSRLSLQYHRRWSEEWLCLRGRADATIGPERLRVRLDGGDRVAVPLGVHHRLESAEGADALEVATGLFDENDIARLEDDYSRAPANKS